MHDIFIKQSLLLMVLRWGRGGGWANQLLPHYHPNEKNIFLMTKAECLCGWMETGGGSRMAGKTINPLCGSVCCSH